MATVNYDVLIVGAGLSGLMAAKQLQQQGQNVLLVDKGRSVGGRLATRRMGAGRADHGAQFFTVRTPAFQAWVETWSKQGLIFQWSTGWSDGSILAAPSDGHPRYAIRGGMNALAQHLAQGLQVQVDTRLTQVRLHAAGWQAEVATGQQYTARALLLTPPVPQSLALLEAGQVTLAPYDQVSLEEIEYAPCLAGLFLVEGPVNLPEPGSIQRLGSSISWIADNQRKGISPDAKIITVHAGSDYSRQHWETPDEEVMDFFMKELAPFFENETKIVEAQYKQWRYALPVVTYPDRYLLAQDLPPLVFAGDAFGGPRVEGAALSGLAAGTVIHEQLPA